LERTGGELLAGDDAAETGFYPLDDLPRLAFDHEEMVRAASSRNGPDPRKQ